MRNTLVAFAEELNKTGESWLLTGRTAAALQGAVIHGNSLTIMTTQTVCEHMGERMDRYRTQKIKHRELPPWRGSIGAFRHESIDITMIGDPEFSIGNRTASIPVDDIFLSIEPFEVSLTQVALMPIDWIAFVGFLEGDHDVLRSVIALGVTKDSLRSITDLLSLSYVMKSDIDGIFKHN